MEDNINKKISFIRGQIAAICGLLGHLCEGEYLVEPDCIEGIKDLIRLLKRDGTEHLSRICMGEVNIVQNHLIHILKICQADDLNLFSVSLRLLINVTTPPILLYNEEVPHDKTNQHIYLALISHDQKYKLAFSDIELWNKICCRLTNLFEKSWADRSADDGIEIERILTLIRNVLHIPADVEEQNKPDVLTAHNKILCALRESQILELLLLIASKEDAELYYLNLLEIFSLLLREQNPDILANYEVDNSEEKTQSAEDLLKALKTEKHYEKKLLNPRNFKSTYVIKGMKTASNMDIICHKSLKSLQSINFCEKKGLMRPRKKIIPLDNQCHNLFSSPSTSFFLKEFCVEFLTSNFGNFMNVVKNRLNSGKSLAYDHTYYFWALTFFLKFAIKANLNVDFIKHSLSIESFHFIQTNIELAFEHLDADKKNSANWVKRIHIILKAYQSLLETIFWMDCSKKPLVRAISREIKSNIFYIVEYRELTLNLLLKCDSLKFSIPYLRDLIQTSHLFLKLLEEFSKQSKLVVQKLIRKRKLKKSSRKDENGHVKNVNEKWNEIRNEIYDCLINNIPLPEIVPFDPTLDIPIEDQKVRAMKMIQKHLHNGEFKNAIGFLRSSRKVWPENDCFGSEGIDPADETSALQEIFIANLGPISENEKSKLDIVTMIDNKKDEVEESEESEEREENKEGSVKIIEHQFNLMDYKKRLVNRKVVENCGTLLRNFRKNSDHVNHCAVKLLYRIGWECSMPAMLYQASLFCTLLMILNDGGERFNEINTFTKNLIRKFRKHASKNTLVFVELLFWKTHETVLEIQHGYETYNRKKENRTSQKKTGMRKKIKNDCDVYSDGFIMNVENDDEIVKKLSKKKKISSKTNDADINEKGLENLNANLLTSSASDSEISNDFNSKSDEVENRSPSLQTEVNEKYTSSKLYSDKSLQGNQRKIYNDTDEEVDSENLVADRPSPEKKIGDEKENNWNESDENTENTRFELKRTRLISSDSDLEDLKGDDDKLIEKVKRQKRRSNVIDSDSDEDEY